MSEATNHPKDVKGATGVGKKSKVSSRTSKPRTAPTKTNASGRKRLRPGELDGLVLSQMRKSEEELPITPGLIAKAIGRSSGAVGNCLERLAKAKKVRRAKKSPRAYDLEVTR